MSARPQNPIAPYLLLAGVWLLTISILPPRGDFPLNDDWIYGKIVEHLHETGEYRSNPYGDPAFIAQAYWGLFFVKLFGFSFETLRLSTLVLALVAGWATCWCAREAGLSPGWAILCGLTLLVNPMFVNLSYTFMTDVPFVALCALAGAAYLRRLRTQRSRWLALGSTLVAVAFLVRQFALVMPIAVALLLPISWKADQFRKTANDWVCLGAPILLVGVLYRLLPLSGIGMGEDWDWSRLGDTLIDRAIEVSRHFAFAFAYTALFLLPFLAIVLAMAIAKVRRGDPGKLAGIVRAKGTRLAVSATLAMALFMAWLITRDWPYRLPNFGNLLYDLGVGPLLLPGMLDGSTIAAPARLGAVPWRVVTGVAVAFGSALALLHASSLVRLLIRFRDRSHPARISGHFLALWAFGMILALILPPVLARFDRYFIMAQVPASILAAQWLAARVERPAVVGFVAAALVWLFALLCQQDYLAWNHARWTAISTLQREHDVPLEQINAGYEANAWYHSDRFVEESRATGRKVFGPLGWWTVGEVYRVSMRQGRDYEVIDTVPYFSWLGFQQREMLMLKRVASPE